MLNAYLTRRTAVAIRQAARFVNARRPALPVLLAAGLLLALVATALTTAGVSAADEAETWANRALAAELALPPAAPAPNGPASDAPRFQQVSAGAGYTCGILTDGAVACWGQNDYSGQATPPAGDLPAGQRRLVSHLRRADRRRGRLLGQ